MWNTALDSLSSCAELVADSVFVILGIFQDSVIKTLNGFLEPINIK